MEEDLKTTTEHLTSHVRELMDTYLQLARANAAKQATRAATAGFTVMVLCLLSLCVLILAGIGIAIWFSILMNNAITGYFSAAALYIVLMILFYVFRRRLAFPFIRNFIIRKIYG